MTILCISLITVTYCVILTKREREKKIIIIFTNTNSTELTD